ncbi:MAG TPA: HAD-IIB family hydrolase [Planctomycetota bacterium]|nr:HAD-IIB family hydrolase [Planctomycetota bacterium]
MRYHALACDYDNTIATHGAVPDTVLDALRKVKESGRKLILVTGRVLPDLQSIFPAIGLFDRVVAENGALLYRPEKKTEKILAEPPPGAFVDALKERGVDPIERGKVIVATHRPFENAVLDVVQTLGLELQLIFNRDAVMILPSGVNKAKGLLEALGDLGLSPHNCVGVGDAENDHALLQRCELGVAVANALPALKAHADWVTKKPAGEGVVDLAEKLVKNDLQDLAPRLARHAILLGDGEGAARARLQPYGETVLIAGTSGGGKSTLATAVLEQLIERHYQVCIIDPEGDYEKFEGAVMIGDPKRAPGVREILQLLEDSSRSVSVNLVGIKLEDRPAFFERLFSAIQEMRARTGRPHWLLIDETHHLFPAEWTGGATSLPRRLEGMLLITVHPHHVSKAVLKEVDVLVAIGKAPAQTFRIFAEMLGKEAPAVDPGDLPPGEAIVWRRRDSEAPLRIRSARSKAERQRHRRKYAEGEMEAARCFTFRGPENKLKLRAHNLKIWLLMADGVDEETWLHHLRNGDIARWFREGVKDQVLAAKADEIGSAPAGESLAALRALIEERYTEPE